MKQTKITITVKMRQDISANFFASEIRGFTQEIFDFYYGGGMGFEKVVIREGTGAAPTRGCNVTVHCTGFGKNGDLSKPFWSTKDPGQKAFTFPIGLGKGEYFLSARSLLH